ncbi:MAG: caspase family protein [Desulforhopalus sp.]|nr:caspase family protein [Desulforhopalus sp.]
MKTLALVIGNNNYPGRSKLNNAVNDAFEISETFRKLHYKVIYKENCVSSDYGDLLTEFESQLPNFDASIFYFAGHGFQFDGENYLASIECPIEHPTKHSCERTCIRLAELTEIIRKATTKINIIIIDACRRSFSRGVASSFTQVNAPEGTIIAFSTSPGEGAKDSGIEGHSLYTGVLLKYIGREFLSVEELFKKTRRTVYNLSDGTQTSWEHTSLVGDFYFNTGQMIYSVSIPYDESVVKDRMFVSKGTDIDQIISDLRSCNWDKQNPAMSRFKLIAPQLLNKNQQFIIGRNILQASGYAYNATDFMDNLDSRLAKYNNDDENHVLNGILYEIYFDNNGDFRKGKFKTNCIDKVFALRHRSNFEQSFKFIDKALAPYRSEIYYVPGKADSTIDVDVLARNSTRTDFSGVEKECQTIDSIHVFDRDITQTINKIHGCGGNLSYLKKTMIEFLVAPEELVNLNSNIPIDNLCFEEPLDTIF